MNKYLFLSFLLIILLSSEGCRRRASKRSSTTNAAVMTAPGDSTTAAQPASATAATSLRIEKARTEVADVEFNYLTAKAKIGFKSPQEELDNATINIRVQKDSLIWLSVSKLGIEAVRGLISRDSIVIIDKIHREYSVYDFATLSRRFNFTMNFALLQALVLGNVPLPNQPAQKTKDGPDSVLLRQQNGNVLVENYIGTENRKLKKLMLTEQPVNNTLRLEYSDFAALSNYLFPYASLMTLNYRSLTDGQFSQTELRIKYNKVELADQNPGFPFTVPASYKRRL